MPRFRNLRPITWPRVLALNHNRTWHVSEIQESHQSRHSPLLRLLLSTLPITLFPLEFRVILSTCSSNYWKTSQMNKSDFGENTGFFCRYDSTRNNPPFLSGIPEKRSCPRKFPDWHSISSWDLRLGVLVDTCTWEMVDMRGICRSNYLLVCQVIWFLVFSNATESALCWVAHTMTMWTKYC